MTKIYGADLEERRRKRAEEFGDREVEILGVKLLLRLNVPYGVFAVQMNQITDAEDVILSLLEAPEGDPEAIDRLRDKLRAEYTKDDLVDLMRDLIGDVARRPTEVPESSGNGHATTGTSSTGTSSSTPGAA